MMENKPTTRIINIIMTGLFIIIAITLVTIAGSFYTVEQNAKKSGQEQLMRTLNYVTNNLKLVIENRSLSLQQFSHELTSDDHPEAPLGEADKEAIIVAYLGMYADQTNLLIQLDGSGVLAEAWQFKNGALQELSGDIAETYLQADPTLESLLGSGSLVQNSSDYFLENQSFVNLYSPIVADDGQITGYFIAKKANASSKNKNSKMSAIKCWKNGS